MNTSFVFYTEYRDFIELLSPEDTKKLILIIIDYVETKKEPNKPNLSDRLLMVWIAIKKRLDTDKTKYDKRCETSKINGTKGGRPKKQKNLNKPKKADNDNDYVNEYDGDNEPDYEENKEEVFNDSFYSIIEENFGYTLPSMLVTTLNEWRNIFDDEIILYAVKICCNNNVRNLSYLEAILNDWKNKGFKKLIDCKNGKKDNKTNNKVIHENKVPEWFGKDIKKVEATSEEIANMQQLLSEFKYE